MTNDHLQRLAKGALGETPPVHPTIQHLMDRLTTLEATLYIDSEKRKSLCQKLDDLETQVAYQERELRKLCSKVEDMSGKEQELITKAVVKRLHHILGRMSVTLEDFTDECSGI